MGLSIHYRLTLPGHTSVEEVRAKLDALREFATTVGFEQVLGPTEYTIDDLVDLADRDWVKICASTLSADPPDFYGVPWGSSCAIAFLVLPGQECEPAIFAFLAPGARSSIAESENDLRPGDWFWSSSCKTQYASNVSDDHFIKCHLGLVRTLDHATTLGIQVEVQDETGFWEHRSTEKLLHALRDMNRIIARFAGALHDQLGSEHTIEAPIFDHSDFEHLEMEDIGFHDQADGTDADTA